MPGPPRASQSRSETPRGARSQESSPRGRPPYESPSLRASSSARSVDLTRASGVAAIRSPSRRPRGPSAGDVEDLRGVVTAHGRRPPRTREPQPSPTSVTEGPPAGSLWHPAWHGSRPMIRRMSHATALVVALSGRGRRVEGVQQIAVRVAAHAVPVAVNLAMPVVYRRLARRLGPQRGYLAGSRSTGASAWRSRRPSSARGEPRRC